LARQINSVLDRYETEHNVGVVRSGDETDAGRSAGQPASVTQRSAASGASAAAGQSRPLTSFSSSEIGA